MNNPNGTPQPPLDEQTFLAATKLGDFLLCKVLEIEKAWALTDANVATHGFVLLFEDGSYGYLKCTTDQTEEIKVSTQFKPYVSDLDQPESTSEGNQIHWYKPDHINRRLRWNRKCSEIADRMLDFTRPFVTALGTPTANKERLAGSGSYVGLNGLRLLLTCQHVTAKFDPLDHYFFGLQGGFEHPGPWCVDPHPKDVAMAVVADSVWLSAQHKSQALPFDRFGHRHQICQPEEPLFFRGYAGENSTYDGMLNNNGTGYLSQEVKNSGDAQIFEMFWEPENTCYSCRTTKESRQVVKFEEPPGLSGSLVWNTRYLEVTTAGREWTPEDAVVTGLLRRWECATKRLLVWRVEHLRQWLES